MMTLGIQRAVLSTRGFFLALAALGALLIPAASAFAHPADSRVLVDGRWVTHAQYGMRYNHNLNANDYRVDDGSRVEWFQFDGRQGDCALITMDSSSIDSYLELRFGRPGADSLRTDDDSGPGYNARIRTVLPRTGVYYIFAGSYGASDYGRYTLTLERC
jgi:hypothetical protein